MKKRTSRPRKSIFPAKERRRVRLWGSAGGALAALAVVLFLAASVQPVFLRQQETAAVISAVLVDLANEDRADSALPQLAVDPRLVEAAQMKADDMAQYGYFAHVSPTGVDPWHWFTQAGYSFQYAGENLAVDFSDSGDVNTAWMNSPEHRANLLDPHFTQIGIATASGMYQGKLVTFVVQEFGTPAPSASQQPIEAAAVPQNPAQPALAAAPTAPVHPSVLGSAQNSPITALAQQQNTPAPAPQPLPWWAPLVNFPRESLQIAYFILGLLVVLTLAYTTRFEVRSHHLKHAKAAVALVLLLCVLFAAADYFIFAQPVLAAAASTL